MDVSNVKHLDMHVSSLTQTEGVSLLSAPTGLYELRVFALPAAFNVFLWGISWRTQLEISTHDQLLKERKKV